MNRWLPAIVACLLISLLLPFSGCGVDNTAQEPDSTPPMPTGAPVPAGSSTAPPPPPGIPRAER